MCYTKKEGTAWERKLSEGNMYRGYVQGEMSGAHGTALYRPPLLHYVTLLIKENLPQGKFFSFFYPDFVICLVAGYNILN